MDSAPSPPPPSRATRLLWTTAAVAGYPPAFLFAYLLCLGLPYGTIPTATNVAMPVFPILAALLAAVAFARYRLWRTLRRKYRRDDGTDAWLRFRLAHKPAALCLPLTLPLCFAPMEGNAFGFVVLPTLLLLTLAIGVWVQRRLWRRA
ncbi:hypothetical protein [Solidesulfovibrio sp.]|uniref:hypothetical protein n=1 Tax=Solidesulfovibrio sp. TaxID=2910990 RepID=UPI002B209F94|nr:hypothetical protein [Solidesulfovibrio sp.]MEA5088322.1 hypothetical protein [Solidesulfovibrio sp.]